MIMLQRKILIKIRDAVVDEGKGAQNVKSGTYYPVIGYQVEKRKSKPKAGEVERHEREEVSAYIIINEKGYLSYVWPSQFDSFIDPVDSSTAGNGKVSA